MKELKGLETHEFYSRFFVETALLKQEQMNTSADEAKKLMSLGESFYTKYNDFGNHPHDQSKLKDLNGWFHAKLTQELGYNDLEVRVYETTAKKGIVVRGTKKLVDQEELWIIEGHAGHSFNNEDPFEMTPHCSSAELVEGFEVDKSKSYRKIFDELFSDENENVGWALFLAGERTYLLEKEKWLDKGTFVEIDWLEVFNNKANETFKAIIGLFGARGFKVENGEIAHNLLAETAHREAHGVTKSLKFSVRDALEILVNEALDSHKKNPSPYIQKMMDENPENLAKDLSAQGLRYLYRLLFLFYVEARGRESEILPVKSPAYQMGYSLENLRNLELVNKSIIKNGTFVQQTLERTFNLMFDGYNINEFAEFDENLEQDDGVDDADIYSAGFECPKVGALLFNPRMTPVFDEVELRDSVMQKVIAKLSLAEVGSGKNAKTHRISYANLGLNQLGAVYEGLLSLKAVITDREYYTVVLGTRDEEFLIPTEERTKFKGKIKKDSNDNEILHEKGTFLFRTMGYERKYSASFYTDEALTQCLVKECLAEYFKDNEKPKVAEIEKMKVLEPAMGSGAFLNEVANQLAVFLAKGYKREKKEYKDTSMKDLNDIAKEHIMRNCLYGVDLNPMAAELAKVSLWLNCIRKDSKSAFHDFKIRHGNSLVGAFVRQKTVWNTKIHHFLEPMPEMVDTYLDARELGDKKMPFFDEARMKKLNEIKTSFKNIKDYEDRLETMAKILDGHYKVHTAKRIAFQNLLQDTDKSETEINKEYQAYIDNNAEFHKLKLIMDYWSSLWFWNPKDVEQYPNAEEFLSDIENILELNIKEYASINNQLTSDKNLKRVVCSREIIKSVPFFHYDLEFPEVFDDGGFDLIVGNPPWAKIAWSDYDFFSDRDVQLLIKKPKASEEEKILKSYMSSKSIVDDYKKGFTLIDGMKKYLTASRCYPCKDSSKINTYKYFWQRSTNLSSERGVYGLIKQNGIVTDDGTEKMRPIYYKELTKLYRFLNTLTLFDVHSEVEYVLSVFNKSNKKIEFELIDSLYHPLMIKRCYAATVFDKYPSKKLDNGKPCLDGHPDRIINVNNELLETILESSEADNYGEVTLPKIYGSLEWKLLKNTYNTQTQLKENEYSWTQCFNETNSPKKEKIKSWGKKHSKNEDAVLCGSNIFIGNPFFQESNPDTKNSQDYLSVDLNEIDENYKLRTKYKLLPSGKEDSLKKGFTEYRLCCKEYVNLNGSRTLTSCLIPIGTTHIHALTSLTFADEEKLLTITGLSFSLLYDFFARNITTGHITKSFWRDIPILSHKLIDEELKMKVLRLNCLTSDFSELWKKHWSKSYRSSPALDFFPPNTSTKKLNSTWSWDSPVRDSFEREQILCEIDSLVAMMMGVSKEELIRLYRSQFGALQKKLKDLPGQNEEDSFPRAKIMEAAYDMYLEHFGVSEKDVVAGYFQDESKSKVA